MQTNAIALRDVSKTYSDGRKEALALEGFSLDIPAGSVVSLMGASGCGKSTVTKIIAGIIAHDAGSLSVDGVEYGRGGIPAAIRKRMGYVFQWHNLTEWRTVENNLYFPLEMFGEKRDGTWKERADRYLKLVGLGKYGDVYPRELSGGMKQRVGIARALMTEPDMLIFDQPYGALDAITRGMLSSALFDIVRKERKTMLMVTSDVDEAVRYSDFICVMKGRPGRVKRLIHSNLDDGTRRQADFWQLEAPLQIKLEATRAIYGET